MLKPKIDELKQRLLDYAFLVESMIEKSLQGLTHRDEELLRQIIAVDEVKANRNDNEIDEICTQLIAQYEPVAGDLRMVLMILKMNKDLERMADHVVNISESNAFLIKLSGYQPSEDILIMTKTAASMLKDSITAFINLDSVLAQDVCKRDNVVDDIADKILRDLIVVMQGKKNEIKKSLHIMRVSHNLERIADLSTNLCEEVIYIVEGKDIKHHR